MINIVQDFSEEMRYELQPRKTNIIIIRPDGSHNQFKLHGQPIAQKTEVEHLGVVRDKSGGPSLQMQTNITKARKAAFRLFGAGLHGKNGLPQAVCIRLLTRDVIPVLTYGLHIFQLDENSVKPVEIALKALIKQLLSISSSTGDPFLPILTGIPPAQAIIESNALAMLGSICRNTDSMEHKLGHRHLAIKSESSWFGYCDQILTKLDLPSLSELLSGSPISKPKWKSIYKRATHEYWRTKAIRLISTYPSARFLNPHSMRFGTPHPIIRLAPCTMEHVKRCTTTLQLISGTYILQSNRSNFNQHGTNPTCLLCKTGPENRVHMISRCRATEHIRTAYKSRILDSLSKHCKSVSAIEETFQDPGPFAQIVLDCTTPALTHITPFPSNVLGEIITCCQKFIHSLSAERLSLLQRIAPQIQRKRKKRQRVSKNPSHKSHPHAYNSHNFSSRSCYNS